MARTRQTPLLVPDTRNVKVPMKLTDKELLDFFKGHDADKNKKLSWAELKQAFSDLGVNWVNWTTDRALVKADDDDDGYISETELEKLVQFAHNCKLTAK